VIDTIRALANTTTLETSLELTDKALQILAPGIHL